MAKDPSKVVKKPVKKPTKKEKPFFGVPQFQDAVKERLRRLKEAAG